MLLTYIGTADFRTFSTNDSVGVDLVFSRNIPLEVDVKTAKLILGDENLSIEFVEGSTPDNSIDDAQEPLPGLEGDS